MFTLRERILRVLVRGMVAVLYRLRVRGFEAVPSAGPAIVVANHVSYLDAAILGALAPRPVRWVMSREFYEKWPLSWFFRACGAIPIVGRREDPELLAQALKKIDETLARGEVIGLFPEGRLTRDGALCAFRPGIEGMLERSPAPVVPVALKGLWGSFFSYAGGAPLAKWPRRFRSRIEVVVGSVIAPERASAASLEHTIAGMLSAR